MLNLMLTVMAIAMASAASLATLSYIDLEATYAHRLAARLEPAMRALASGYKDYVDANATAPATLTELTPAYAFVPIGLEQASWSYGGAYGGHYACLSGTASAAEYRALTVLADRFSPQAYFIATACGAIADSPPGPGAAASSGVAVTYWLSTYSP